MSKDSMTEWSVWNLSPQQSCKLLDFSKSNFAGQRYYFLLIWSIESQKFRYRP